MAKIKTPVAKFNGESAGVTFVNGEGYTDDKNKISWFKKHGYFVSKDKKSEESEIPPENKAPDILDTMSAEELTVFAQENEIDIGKSTSKEGILKKILAANDGGDDTDDEG